MARPKCPKCDHTSFQSSEIKPVNSNFRLLAVHCAKCGAIVGVTDCDDVGSLVHSLANALDVAI
jgi:predicted nucleic-acid-binding Zn-ribbon protein